MIKKTTSPQNNEGAHQKTILTNTCGSQQIQPFKSNKTIVNDLQLKLQKLGDENSFLKQQLQDQSLIIQSKEKLVKQTEVVNILIAENKSLIDNQLVLEQQFKKLAQQCKGSQLQKQNQLDYQSLEQNPTKSNNLINSQSQSNVKELKDCQKQLENLKKQSDEQSEENELLKKQINDRDLLIQQNQSALVLTGKRRSEIEILEKKCEDLLKSNKEFDERIYQMAQEYENIQGLFQKIKEQKDQLKKQNQELQNNIKNMEEQNEFNQKAQVQFNDMQKQMEEECFKMKSQINHQIEVFQKDKNKLFQEAMTKRNQLESQIKVMESEIQTIEPIKEQQNFLIINRENLKLKKLLDQKDHEIDQLYNLFENSKNENNHEFDLQNDLQQEQNKKISELNCELEEQKRLLAEKNGQFESIFNRNLIIELLSDFQSQQLKSQDLLREFNSSKEEEFFKAKEKCKIKVRNRLEQQNCEINRMKEEYEKLFTQNTTLLAALEKQQQAQLNIEKTIIELQKEKLSFERKEKSYQEQIKSWNNQQLMPKEYNLQERNLAMFNFLNISGFQTRGKAYITVIAIQQ